MLSPGAIVGGCYAIRGEIASSPTGTVYEARDMILERPVALKVGRPDALSLILESRRISDVRDSCAVAIHALGRHDGHEFVVAERVTGALLRDTTQLSTEAFLARLRAIAAAVVRAGTRIGDLSGGSILLVGERVVFGALSLSQVPIGPREIDDLYGLGCVAIEMAGGLPAPGDDTRPPRIADLRPDLPVELSDLVEWCLATHPPTSMQDALCQLDAIIERAHHRRPTRVLIVDDDGFRARKLWSLARRAHPGAIVETASEGSDAAHKLVRDHPELVIIDGELRGAMTALELCRYARNLDVHSTLVVIGGTEHGLATFAAERLADDGALPHAVQERVRAAAADRPARKKRPTMITG